MYSQAVTASLLYVLFIFKIKMILSSIRTQTYYSIWHWPFGTNKKSKCVQDAGHKSPESRPGPEARSVFGGHANWHESSRGTGGTSFKKTGVRPS